MATEPDEEVADLLRRAGEGDGAALGYLISGQR
jgi:hypothetical protein